METKHIFFELRTKNGLSQDELAEKLYVTRQTVSRWENGEILPKRNHWKDMNGRDGIVYYCRRPQETVWNEHEIAVNMLKRGFRDFFQTEFREADVERKEYGKPYYAANPNLKFNISHCRDGVAVVISDREVGVDVESMRRVNRRTVKKCCSREEISYVFRERESSQEESISGNLVMPNHPCEKEENDILQDAEAKRFLTLWTLKESYVKMTGEGLRTSFDQVCFLPPDLQKMGEKEVKEIKGFDDNGRSYLYFAKDLILALTVQWGDEKRIPDFLWKEILIN